MADFSFSYKEFDDLSELEAYQQNLVSKAVTISNQAYAPYSNFKVGCAVLLQNGNIHTGANVENASYPVGICAERSALSYVVSNFPNEKIKSIAISYFSEKENKEVIFPCGMCRQFILECQERNKGTIELILHAQEGKTIIINNANDLLPFGFTGKIL